MPEARERREGDGLPGEMLWAGALGSVIDLTAVASLTSRRTLDYWLSETRAGAQSVREYLRRHILPIPRLGPARYGVHDIVIRPPIGRKRESPGGTSGPERRQSSRGDVDEDDDGPDEQRGEDQQSDDGFGQSGQSVGVGRRNGRDVKVTRAVQRRLFDGSRGPEYGVVLHGQRESLLARRKASWERRVEGETGLLRRSRGSRFELIPFERQTGQVVDGQERSEGCESR